MICLAQGWYLYFTQRVLHRRAGIENVFSITNAMREKTLDKPVRMAIHC